MGLPVWSTTFTVRRVVGEPDDPWDTQPSPTVVATGVKAHISKPAGRTEGVGDTQTMKLLPFVADPSIQIMSSDEIVDERTGRVYQVGWVRLRPGMFGLGHNEGTLELTEGFSS